MDDAAWLDLIRAGQPPFWRVMALSSGGAVYDDGDVFGAMVPAAPERSVFNSVFYREPRRLAAALPELARRYDRAGVRAWTVWVPEADTAAAELLAEGGHVLDAAPRAMAMELARLAPPRPSVADVVESDDIGELARINDVAYAYPEGTFAAALGDAVPGTRTYLGLLGGVPVGCALAFRHGDDCAVAFVATRPEAQGHGVGAAVMGRLLADAREAGMRTTTLQATRAGRPLYKRLGYRDLGALQMWERRRA